KKTVPPMYPVVHVLAGGGQAMPVYIRGNPQNKGELTPTGFLTILSDAAAGQGGSGDQPNEAAELSQAEAFNRLDLARAIAHPDNPLTARVLVNRVWQHHFGRGLVGTSSNFGLLGDRPT